MRERADLRTGILAMMGVGLAGFASCAGLSLFGVHVNFVVTAIFGLMGILAPTALSWLAVRRAGPRRREVLLAAGAVTSWTAGSLFYVGMISQGAEVPFPSIADWGSALFYAFMAGALVTAVRRRARGAASLVWWDAAVGSLGAAAVLAVVLDPVLAVAFSGHGSLAAMGLAVYPFCDLVLLAAIIGAAALRDVGMGRRWALFAAGMLVFAAADVTYSLQRAAGTFTEGSTWDTVWITGIALIALWVDGSADERTTARSGPSSAALSLVLSSGTTLAALGVLLVNVWAPVPTLALTLAGVTMLAAAARSELAFGRLSRLAGLLRRKAATDELTGLANRRAITSEGQGRFAAQPWRQHAVLVLDVDKFKEVNDSLGHHVGDQLLTKVGARLAEQLGPRDVLARLGSDEFAILLDGADHDQAVESARRLRAALDEPFELRNIALHSSVSVGIAVFPDDAVEMSTLLSKADRAMYKAKAELQGYYVYSTIDDADDATRLQTVEELRTALAARELVLHYQPKVDLSSGEVRSVEALVRWEHPTRGLLYPDAFLSLVEEFGLMPALTEAVLEMALDQSVRWAAQGRPLTIAVNLSASSLVDRNLPNRVAEILARHDVAPDRLQLEITEEFLMADRDRARSILLNLRDSGIQLSVDDFGTGYSSLSYLLELPVDELKLDRSLVYTMSEDTRANALVASTIALAHSLDLRLVAEGVETEGIFTELRRLGCDQAQGYFVSRPLPASQLDQWLVDLPRFELHGAVAAGVERGQ